MPSPEPNEIVELEAIRDLLDGGVVVICAHVRYDTPEQQALSSVSVAETELYTAEGHFKAGTRIVGAPARRQGEGRRWQQGEAGRERRAVEDGPRKVGPDVGAGGWMSR